MTTPAATPFEELIQLTGPNGDLCRKPCGYSAIVEDIEVVCIGGRLSMNGQIHAPHEACSGTGTVFDPTHPLAAALWEKSVSHLSCSERKLCFIDGPYASYYRGREQESCGATGYVHRSEAEVALRLLEAVEAMWPSYHASIKHGHLEWLNPDCADGEAICPGSVQGDNHLIEEIAAALLQAVKQSYEEAHQ